jgi:YHS domain-containing protein
MKKILLPLCILFASCQEASVDGTIVRQVDDATMPASAAVATVNKGDIDPVCGMVRTNSWTNYSLYKGDTVWFCAAVEKKAFDAAPEKYAAKLDK